MAGEKPTAAMVLAIIGGFFIIIGGLAIFAISSLLSGILGNLTANGTSINIPGVSNILTIYGSIGIAVGVLTIVLGILAYVKTNLHIVAGVLLIIFAIMSAIFAVFGLFIGLLLTLIAGILFLVFKPARGSESTMMQEPSS